MPRLAIRRRSSRAPSSLEQRVQQHDDLGVDAGVVGADRLGADLPELAVAAGLRALVAEERPEVPELHGLRRACASRARGRRGRPARCPRAQQRRTVLEGVHLLLDDVGRLPHAAREQLGVLEHRRLDAAVAGAPRGSARSVLDRLARGRVGGQHVERAARGLELGAHASSVQERVRRALAAERGQAHVAREDALLVGVAVQQRLDRARRASASRRRAGRCGRPSPRTGRRR